MLKTTQTIALLIILMVSMSLNAAPIDNNHVSEKRFPIISYFDPIVHYQIWSQYEAIGEMDNFTSRYYYYYSLLRDARINYVVGIPLQLAGRHDIYGGMYSKLNADLVAGYAQSSSLRMSTGVKENNTDDEGRMFPRIPWYSHNDNRWYPNDSDNWVYETGLLNEMVFPIPPYGKVDFLNIVGFETSYWFANEDSGHIASTENNPFCDIILAKSFTQRWQFNENNEIDHLHYLELDFLHRIHPDTLEAYPESPYITVSLGYLRSDAIAPFERWEFLNPPIEPDPIPEVQVIQEITITYEDLLNGTYTVDNVEHPPDEFKAHIVGPFEFGYVIGRSPQIRIDWHDNGEFVMRYFELISPMFHHLKYGDPEGAEDIIRNSLNDAVNNPALKIAGRDRMLYVDEPSYYTSRSYKTVSNIISILISFVAQCDGLVYRPETLD